VAADDDLSRASATIERNVEQVRSFLKSTGVDSAGTEITLQDFSVRDQRASGGYSEQHALHHQSNARRAFNACRHRAGSESEGANPGQGRVCAVVGEEYGAGGQRSCHEAERPQAADDRGGNGARA
jgi:hypothetical protein